MKHLLIILSILFLSSPVIGDNHKGETLYRWGKYPYVWKGFGDKETHPIYKGDVQNGKPSGLGFLIFPKKGRNIKGLKKYVGSWKNGKYNGEGTFTRSDGGKYFGEWKDNREWNGRMYHKNGKIIFTFVNGKLKE